MDGRAVRYRTADAADADGQTLPYVNRILGTCTMIQYMYSNTLRYGHTDSRWRGRGGYDVDDINCVSRARGAYLAVLEYYSIWRCGPRARPGTAPPTTGSTRACTHNRIPLSGGAHRGLRESLLI